MTKQQKAEYKKALNNFKNAYLELLTTTENTIEEFSNKYPFHKCFLELHSDVISWIEGEIKEKELQEAKNEI